MAKIVLGLGTSHSPMLSTTTDIWPEHGERDKRNPQLLTAEGEYLTYEQLLQRARPGIQAEIEPDVWQSKYERMQKGIKQVGDILAEVRPDVLIVVGDDQEEFFEEENTPALAVYWGEELVNRPSAQHDKAPADIRKAFWGYYGTEAKSYPGCPELGRHVIASLVEQGFDVAQSHRQREDITIGHAWGFIHRRLMDPHGLAIPMVPVMLNTYSPPNQPPVWRCYQLGKAIKKAVESWDSDQRVAVIASGGLSHFVVLEELDKKVLKALAEHDEQMFFNLPEKIFQSGTSEIKNWIAAGAALEHLKMEVLDYVPAYRSLAGTGGGWTWAVWQ